MELYQSKLNPLRLTIPEDLLQQIQSIIEEKNYCQCPYHIRGNSVWFLSTTDESELRLLTLGDISVTVSRVGFSHRRAGTMTEIISLLEQFCKEKGIKKLVVQSVETEEMAAFCKKFGYVPDPNCSLMLDDFVYGDYVKEF